MHAEKRCPTRHEVADDGHQFEDAVGAGRGQGRSQALRMAREGADMIAVELCALIDTVPKPLVTPEELAETVRQFGALDRRIVATHADARDTAAINAAVDDGVAQLCGPDIVAANAGIERVVAARWLTGLDMRLRSESQAGRAGVVAPYPPALTSASY